MKPFYYAIEPRMAGGGGYGVGCGCGYIWEMLRRKESWAQRELRSDVLVHTEGIGTDTLPCGTTINGRTRVGEWHKCAWMRLFRGNFFSLFLCIEFLHHIDGNQRY